MTQEKPLYFKGLSCSPVFLSSLKREPSKAVFLCHPKVSFQFEVYSQDLEEDFWGLFEEKFMLHFHEKVHPCFSIEEQSEFFKKDKKVFQKNSISKQSRKKENLFNQEALGKSAKKEVFLQHSSSLPEACLKTDFQAELEGNVKEVSQKGGQGEDSKKEGAFENLTIKTQKGSFLHKDYDELKFMAFSFFNWTQSYLSLLDTRGVSLQSVSVEEDSFILKVCSSSLDTSKRYLDIFLTYRFFLSCVHSHENKKLTPEENKKLFYKCASPHGHEYTLKVGFRQKERSLNPSYETQKRGERDEPSVMHKNKKLRLQTELQEQKDSVLPYPSASSEERFADPLKRGAQKEQNLKAAKDSCFAQIKQLIQKEVEGPFHQNHWNQFIENPTGENISTFLFQRLSQKSGPSQLHFAFISVKETQKNKFYLQGSFRAGESGTSLL